MSVYIENFETIFGVKDNIQALRNKVLELAIKGKLVEKDPNDEPASELIKKIKTEKDRLVEEGKIKKQKSLATIEEDEIPFNIPDNWEWVRLNELADFIDYRGKTPNKTASGIPLITAKNIKWGFISDTPEEFISESDYWEWMVRGIPDYGNIVFTTEAPLGNVARLLRKDKFALAQRAITFKTHINVIDSFLLYALMSDGIRQMIFAKATGTTVLGIKASELKEILIPLPPMAEQNRIAAKIEFLMSEIDKLEESLEKKEQLMDLLPKAVVDAIGSCHTGEELKEQLQLVTENFETIFQTPESMQELRNVILQLAIEGKLVPQDPADEPASELVKRIQAERDKLVKEGKIKKQQPLAPIEEDEILFEIPKSWEWVRLGSVTNYGDNITILPQEIKDSEWVLELEDIEKNTSRIIDTVYNSKRQSKSNKNRFEKGYVLYGKLRPYLKKVLVAPSKGVCSTEIIAFKGYCGISADYIVNYLKSRYIDVLVNSITHGMNMPRLGTENARSLLFPLPPLAEQHRIVSKVELIMSLIDRMEERLRKKINLVENMASERYL